MDNEASSLRHGVYNLGFLGIRNDQVGKRMASWWSDRLLRFCYDETAKGIFVDQKWCDLVPSFFPGVGIVRDPGYNVASWNLSQRKVGISQGGDITVNDSLLRFFHFTKLGPIGDTMTQRYARDNTVVYELWSWYRRMIERHACAAIPDGWWQFAKFTNGVRIDKRWRVLYRQRRDLQDAFADPFETSGHSFYGWLGDHGLLGPDITG